MTGDTTLLLLIVLLAGAATYLWRLLGVLAAQRLDPNGELLKWLSCVATAIVAALCIKLALVPPEILADTMLATRLGAFATGVAAFYLASNATIGVAASFLTIIVMEQVVRPLLS